MYRCKRDYLMRKARMRQAEEREEQRRFYKAQWMARWRAENPEKAKSQNKEAWYRRSLRMVETDQHV